MNRRSVVVRFLIGMLMASGLPCVGQELSIRGVVLDPAQPRDARGVKDMIVCAYRLEPAPRAKDGVRLVYLSQSLPTTAEGRFEFPFIIADRVSIFVMDAEASLAKPKRYATARIEPLSGQAEIVINPAVQSSGGQSTESRRREVTWYSQLLRDNPAGEPRERIYQHIEAAMAEVQKNPRVAYGAELYDAVAAVRGVSPQPEIAVTSTIALIGNPGDDSEPQAYQLAEPKEGRHVKLSTTRVPAWPKGDGESAYPTLIIPTKSGLFRIRATEQGRTVKSQYEILADDQSAWESIPVSGIVTSAAGVAWQALRVKGTEDGTVVISSAESSRSSLELPLGRTPVAATALSNDGKRVAGVTIDGEYQIWEITDAKTLQTNKLVGGRLSTPFPVTMAFSTDGKSLVVGTGLGNRHNAVEAVDLRPTSLGKSAVWKCPATVTKVGFGNDATKMLAAAADGNTYVLDVRLSETNITIVQADFQFKNLDGFGFLPKANLAVLKLRGNDAPLVVPASSLFDKSKIREAGAGLQIERP